MLMFQLLLGSALWGLKGIHTCVGG